AEDDVAMMQNDAEGQRTGCLGLAQPRNGLTHTDGTVVIGFPVAEEAIAEVFRHVTAAILDDLAAVLEPRAGDPRIDLRRHGLSETRGVFDVRNEQPALFFCHPGRRGDGGR
ncbi:MAG: hypothetical protein ACK56I_11920, partial [bacterium]